MKTKSFAMLALSGLLATSCLYIAPAMADDASSGSSMQQPPADNTPNSNAMPTAPQDGTDGNVGGEPSNNSSNSSANPSDDGGPDTATGDDDY